MLALDLAGRSGFSILFKNSTIKTGISTLTRGNLTGKRNPLPMVRLYRRLSLISKYYSVQKVIFEETFARGSAKYRLDSLQHAVVLWAIQNHINWQRVSPTAWKKATMGNARATKEQYSEYAINNFRGERFWTDDMCAARLILHQAIKENRTHNRLSKKGRKK